MSIQNFVPTVWAARIQKELEAKYVFAELTNRDYEGDISSFGDSVKINNIGDISVDDYVKNSTVITPEQLTSTQQELSIDQAKYLAFYVDDVDAAQTKPKVMDEAVRKSSRALAAQADTFIANLMNDGAGLTGPAGALSVTDIPNFMGTIVQQLDEADNDPDEERFIVVPAWLKKLIVTSFQGNTQSVDVQANGLVGRYYGLNVYMSNRLPDADAGTDSVYLAGTRSGATMAEQIVSMEAYRPESSFSDAVKGLHVYGAKVVLPNALLRGEVSESV